MRNLVEVTKGADDSGRGSYMFWFTAVGCYSLDKPEMVMKDVWRTPIDERQGGAVNSFM